MKERTIWLDADQEVSYCPYCHSGNVWPCEKAGLWTCQDCLHDFIVRHRKPTPKPKPRAMSPEEFHALEQKAKEQEESATQGTWICPKCGRVNQTYPYPTRCSQCGHLHQPEHQEESRMTNDQARGVYGSAKRLGYPEDEAKALLTKSFDEATTELNEHWIKNRPPWQAPIDFTAPTS